MKFECIQFEVVLIVVVDMTLDITNDPILRVYVKLGVFKPSGVEKCVLSSIIRVRV